MHLLIDRVGRGGKLYATKGAPGPELSLDRWTEDELGGALIAMRHTCALDVAADGARLVDVGALLGVTRERVRQIQNAALERLSKPLRGYR